MFTINWITKESPHHIRCILEVINRLKKWHNIEAIRYTDFTSKEQHRQDITCVLTHTRNRRINHDGAILHMRFTNHTPHTHNTLGDGVEFIYLCREQWTDILNFLGEELLLGFLI